LSIFPERKEESLAQMNMLLKSWEDSKEQRDVIMEAKTRHVVAADSNEVVHKGFMTGRGNQFATLTRRSLLTIRRDLPLTKARAGQAVALGLIAGLIYLNTGRDNNTKSVQNIDGVLFFMMMNQSMSGVFGVLQTFPNEIPLLTREYKNRMYSVGVYFLSRCISELPNQIFFPFVFTTICYWMVGLNPDPARFFMFAFLIILTSNTAYSMGYFISAVSPSVQVALALAPVVLIPFFLFGGFFINLDSIPIFLRWLQYVSFFKYGFAGVAITEWQDKTIGCDPGEQCIYSQGGGNQVLQLLSIDSTLGFNIGILFVLLFGFRIVAYFLLYRRALQKPNHT